MAATLVAATLVNGARAAVSTAASRVMATARATSNRTTSRAAAKVVGSKRARILPLPDPGSNNLLED